VHFSVTFLLDFPGPVLHTFFPSELKKSAQFCWR